VSATVNNRNEIEDKKLLLPSLAQISSKLLAEVEDEHSPLSSIDHKKGLKNSLFGR